MTDIPHDPDLPLAVLSRNRRLRARFSFRPEAERFMRMAGTDSWSIVDTTPKPLIPVDAEYMTWKNGEEIVLATKTEEGNWTTVSLIPADLLYHTAASLEGYFKSSGIAPVVLVAREEES